MVLSRVLHKTSPRYRAIEAGTAAVAIDALQPFAEQ
jgi:hypothetical protein